MKNYPHLYTPVNKKTPFSNQIKTQKKNTSIIGNHNNYNNRNVYSKIPSSKTIQSIRNPSDWRANNTPRISSRSIEEIYLDRSSEDNYDLMQRKKLLLQQHRKMNHFYPPPSFGEFGNGYINNYQVDQYSVQSKEENQFFQRSYQKIGSIKFQMQNKNIDQQLNEVLLLIKEQKIRAIETVNTLKKTVDHYKKLCQTMNPSFSEMAVNTDEQINQYKEIFSIDVGVQSEIQNTSNLQSSPSFAKTHLLTLNLVQGSTMPQSSGVIHELQEKKLIDGKQKQIYMKLATMLEDMNINSKQILTQDIQLNFQVKNYKILTEAEIIKIQKFFIKKLVEKLPK